MIIKTKNAIPVFVIILSFVLATYFYPRMPFLMASHWGIDGQVNGFSSKSFALFLLPVLMLILYPIFLFLPKSEPYQKSFNQFQKYYNIFISIIFLFLFYIYVLTLVWNLNIRFNMIQFLIPAFSVIFYYAGFLSSKTKKNWFVGIRTPWAYKNDTVWSKTQKFGGNLFKISALICLLGLFVPKYAFILVLAPIIISGVIVSIYSYLEAKKYK